MARSTTLYFIFLFLIITSCAQQAKIPTTGINKEKGYFYASEIRWSSTDGSLELLGDSILIVYPENDFKGKGSAVFLNTEEAIFLNGKRLIADKKVSVSGYRCEVKRVDKKTVKKAYQAKTSRGGIEITFQSKNMQSVAKDSATITGRFLWNNSKITGFPTKVKITSSSQPTQNIVCSADSLGYFEVRLSEGKYTFSPALYYHWIGEEWIRIDEAKSTIVLDVSAASKKKEVTIPIDTIPWPILQQKLGMLTGTQSLDKKKIDDFVKERMDFFKIPGMSLSVIKDGQIIHQQTYGVTNSNTKKLVTKETLFETGSITKIVFAFAAMRLYEKGELDLDKPLHQYLEHPQINDERYKLMTARHVLSHKSGISNWPRRDQNDQFKLNFTPGTKYGYSGKAFEYLKDVLVEITGKEIETILQEEVMIPLGLPNMHFKGDDAISKYGANGHKKYEPSDIMMAKRPMVAYSLQTTSQELAKFAIAMNERKGLKKSTYDEMFTPHSERSDGTKWGLGVRIEESDVGTSYGHSGSAGRGFIGNLVFYDERRIGYVALTNSQMGGWLTLPLLNEYLVLGSKFKSK